MTSEEVEEALALDKMLDIVMVTYGITQPKKTIPCPEHEGGFDCTPFCPTCEGNQEIVVKS